MLVIEPGKQLIVPVRHRSFLVPHAEPMSAVLVEVHLYRCAALLQFQIEVGSWPECGSGRHSRKR